MKQKFRALHLLHIAHSALFRSTDRVLKKTEGITTAHQVILFALDKEDGLPSSTVAKRAGHSKSRLTNLVDTLTTKGFVERRVKPEDERVHLLHITDEGRALAKRTRASVQNVNGRLLQPFDEEEQRTIQKFLQHVLDEAGRMEKE